VTEITVLYITSAM